MMLSVLLVFIKGTDNVRPFTIPSDKPIKRKKIYVKIMNADGFLCSALCTPKLKYPVLSQELKRFRC